MAADDFASAVWQADLFKRFPELQSETIIAVALSGGPDSLSLLHVLAGMDLPCRIHALIVDHGLRPESAREARDVSDMVSAWGGVDAFVLTWAQEEKPESRVQEEARRARYEAMQAHCATHNIQHLFLGHHQDDQAETVLFRLAKGSGLDGLSGMAERQNHASGLVLCRPFLDVPKANLIAYCDKNDLPFVRDPSNVSQDFARVRMRQSWKVLEGEGLSSKRLSLTAKRLKRVGNALDKYANNAVKKSIKNSETVRILMDWSVLSKEPEEIVLRVLLKIFQDHGEAGEYGPRLEKTEALLDDLLNEETFRKRTLGGLIFERTGDELIVYKEKSGDA